MWRGLQAARFINKDDHVGGTDYKYWRHELKDLTDEQLQAGLRHTGSFEGVMTWSAFKKLCLEATAKHPSHKKFKALPCKPLSREVLRSRIAQMREELAL